MYDSWAGLVTGFARGLRPVVGGSRAAVIVGWLGHLAVYTVPVVALAVTRRRALAAAHGRRGGGTTAGRGQDRAPALGPGRAHPVEPDRGRAGGVALAASRAGLEGPDVLMTFPAPRTQPLVGHLGRWGTDPLALLEEGASLAPVFRLRLWRTAVVGSSPAWNRFVLGDLDTFRSRGSLSGLSPYLAGGVVRSDLPGHRTLRTQLNPGFHRRAIATMTSALRAVVERNLPTGRVRHGGVERRADPGVAGRRVLRRELPARPAQGLRRAARHQTARAFSPPAPAVPQDEPGHHGGPAARRGHARWRPRSRA